MNSKLFDFDLLFSVHASVKTFFLEINFLNAKFFVFDQELCWAKLSTRRSGPA